MDRAHLDLTCWLKGAIVTAGTGNFHRGSISGELEGQACRAWSQPEESTHSIGVEPPFGTDPRWIGGNEIGPGLLRREKFDHWLESLSQHKLGITGGHDVVGTCVLQAKDVPDLMQEHGVD